MQEILALTLQSMHQDSMRLDRISMNLANALTPGYKRDVVSVRPTSSANSVSFASLINNLTGSNTAPMKTNDLDGAVMVQSDQRPGSLKSTGRSLDLAINSAGYFEVNTPTGPAYTRQGNFNVDVRGRLVTQQGYPVMGKSGEILITSASPAIDEQGFIYEGYKSGGSNVISSRSADRPSDQQSLSQLKVVDFENPQNLRRLGDGLLETDENFKPIADSDIQIRQGFLENSNVSSMQEMVQLMQTMRHFESMQKITSGYDDMVGAAIRKLGDLS
jgi:flagellar basal-body rod protein FlgF